jgi:hypothetical protein
LFYETSPELFSLDLTQPRYDLLCLMIRFLLPLLVCLVFTIPARAQWFNHLSLGVGGYSYIPLSTNFKNNYSVTDGAGVSFVTDYYFGSLEFMVATYRIHPLNSGLESDVTRVLLHWFLPDLQMGPLYTRVAGGVGIENYRYNAPTHHETELIMGLKYEMGIRFRRAELYAEVARQRVYSYHRVNWNTLGAGFRVRFDIPERLQDFVL